MISFLKRIFSGELVQDIINNFDPYHINELTRVELNKIKENTNGTMGKD